MPSADIISECTFKAVRSSGKGGQHVNKTSTKVELYFSIADSALFQDEEKAILLTKLGHLIASDGYLRLTCEEARSQRENKILVIEKFIKLIDKALIPPKKRVKTKKPKAAVEKRLTEKKHRSQIKTGRRNNSEE
ncbi:MAG TPA: alternative ribosome rescue aminoacyl-tRNA hydrolase ArfB [Chitinophagales bacterium]|nr:alternative ribosome rescue aminoacyl-tRNA hydrolase ArfB [Chitinophagales bacterium]